MVGDEKLLKSLDLENRATKFYYFSEAEEWKKKKMTHMARAKLMYLC